MRSKIFILLVCLAVLTGCSGIQLYQTAPTQVKEMEYETFTIPGPEPVSLELPEEWDWWGNGGWLSPDEGQTLAGLRVTFNQAGTDSERRLFNEDATITDKSTITVGEQEMTRYTAMEFLTNASTGQRTLQGYVLLYAFPAPDPELIAGVFVSAQSEADLEKLEPVVEHMATSLQWNVMQ